MKTITITLINNKEVNFNTYDEAKVIVNHEGFFMVGDYKLFETSDVVSFSENHYEEYAINDDDDDPYNQYNEDPYND
jgi:hypothetical protein